MADEVTKETTEGTETGKYLTKKYLIANLQNFWKSIKQYITNQISGFVNKDYVDGALSNTASKEALNSLTTTINKKVEQSEFETLEKTVQSKLDQSALDDALAGKVDKVAGKSLSENDFTDALKTKLENLKDSVVTNSDPGLMSAADKEKLDSIAQGATVVIVDSEWNPNSENPAQSKLISEVISTELAKKADKEADPQDPPDLETSKFIQGYATNEGQIVLSFPQTTEHLKIYARNSDRPIEKVSLWEGNSLVFTNFRDENGDWVITLENPKGTNEPLAFGESFDFYIETLKNIGDSKYKPFILNVKRTNEVDSTEIELLITKIF